MIHSPIVVKFCASAYVITDETNVPVTCFGFSWLFLSQTQGRKKIFLQGKAPPFVSNATKPKDNC